MGRKFGPTEQALWPISVFSGIIMCKVVSSIPILYFDYDAFWQRERKFFFSSFLNEENAIDFTVCIHAH